jgi:hypothetical protein
MGTDPVMISYDRGPAGQFVSGFTVRCTVSGRRVVGTAPVKDRHAEDVKQALINRTCLSGRSG